MAGYLDQYGVGEERRGKLIKRAVLIGIALIVCIALPWYLFKNHAQERVVSNFLSLVRQHNYQAAYQAWVCKSCSYSYDQFLEDWGEKSTVDPKVLRLIDSESCGSGIMLTVRASRDRQDTLWVEKNDHVISFAPTPVCPSKSFWGMAAHLTLGKLRRPFLN